MGWFNLAIVTIAKNDIIMDVCMHACIYKEVMFHPVLFGWKDYTACRHWIGLDEDVGLLCVTFLYV